MHRFEPMTMCGPVAPQNAAAGYSTDTNVIPDRSSDTDTPPGTTQRVPILAERFHTRLCKSFRKSGTCEYGAFCMFAHGKARLRTVDANVRDGLTTTEAIRAWQRVQVASEAAEEMRRYFPLCPPSIPPVLGNHGGSLTSHGHFPLGSLASLTEGDGFIGSRATIAATVPVRGTRSLPTAPSERVHRPEPCSRGGDRAGGSTCRADGTAACFSNAGALPSASAVGSGPKSSKARAYQHMPYMAVPLKPRPRAE